MLGDFDVIWNFKSIYRIEEKKKKVYIESNRLQLFWIMQNIKLHI